MITQNQIENKNKLADSLWLKELSLGLNVINQTFLLVKCNITA